MSDHNGWCYVGYCNASCQVEVISYNCPTPTTPVPSTVGHSTPVLTTTVPPTKSEIECTTVSPPRKVLPYVHYIHLYRVLHFSVYLFVNALMQQVFLGSFYYPHWLLHDLIVWQYRCIEEVRTESGIQECASLTRQIHGTLRKLALHWVWRGYIEK